ncbi:MAG: hypothetical protein N2450_08180 [bacterium]|nr:hypothetical protein [bacterium]
MKLLQSMLTDIQQWMDRVSLLEFYENPKKLDLDAKFNQMIETIRSNEPKRYEKMSLFEILNDISHRNKTDNMKAIERLDREKSEIDLRFDEQIKRIRNEMIIEEGQVKRIKNQLETIPKTLAELDEKNKKFERELNILKELESNPKYEADIVNLTEAIKANEQTREQLLKQEESLKTDLAKYNERLIVLKAELGKFTDEERAKHVMNLKKQIDEYEQINIQEERALKELMTLFHKHLDNALSLRNHFVVIESRLKRDDTLPSHWLEYLNQCFTNHPTTIEGYFTIPTKWDQSYFIPAEVTETETIHTFALLMLLKRALPVPNSSITVNKVIYFALPNGLMATIKMIKNPTKRSASKLYILKRFDEDFQEYDWYRTNNSKIYYESIEGLWLQTEEYSIEIRLHAVPLLVGGSWETVAAMSTSTSTKNKEGKEAS